MNAERRFINQIKAGEALDQVFLVRDKELRTAKTGSLYIQCTLTDRSGHLPGRMWQATEAIYNAIPAEGFLHVKGRAEDYRGSLQFIIDACRPWPSEKVEMEDFLPVSELDIEQMWAELLELLRAVKDEHFRALLKKFQEDRQLVAGFKRAPAAMQMHHPFIGGLLEHTLNVTRAAATLLPLYPKLNADLVLTAAFLHDIGKIAELSSGVAINYTDRGQLVGHITIGVLWVQEKAVRLAAESQPVPQEKLDLLQHVILAHHGVHEYGSPKLPAVPEAFFLHYLDNLDAKMFMTLTAIANDPDADANFTAYHKQLETRVYKRSGQT